MPNPEFDDDTIFGESDATDYVQSSDSIHSDETVKGKRFDLEAFTEMLKRSGLVSADEVRELQDSVDGDSADPESLVSVLLSQNKITPYQAERLRAGRSRGLVLGNYVILEEVGRGGSGWVFKAKHRKMKRVVAIKVLPRDAVHSPDELKRFEREMQAAARLQHANIAASHDVDEADGIHFLVMEFIDGPTLTSLITTYRKQGNQLPIPVAVQLLLQACQGLSYAHSEGIVHRDVKPSNLIVNSKGVLKILDMGLAQFTKTTSDDTEHEQLTETGRLMGTVDYMAPEQALDAKSVDHRADIYSLGGTFYYLLCGKSMVPNGTQAQKLMWHQTQRGVDLREVRKDVPKELQAIFAKMISRRADDRYASVDEVIADLHTCLPSSTEELKIPPFDIVIDRDTTTQRMSQTVMASVNAQAARRRLPWIMALAAVGLLTAGAIWLAVKNGGKNSKANKDGKQIVVPEKDSKPTAEYKAALWAFDKSGVVTIKGEDGKSVIVTKSDDLPKSPHVVGLDFSNAKLSDIELEKIAPLTTVTELRLPKSDVTDAGLKQLLGMKRLRVLDLSKTKITNAGLKHVSSFSALDELNLNDTAITTAGLEHLTTLNRLDQLYLENLNVGNPVVDKLLQIKSLTKVAVKGTALTVSGHERLERSGKVTATWLGEDPIRRSAFKALSAGATLAVRAKDEKATTVVTDPDNLPPTKFNVESMKALDVREFGDEHLILTVGMTDLEECDLRGTLVTSAGLTRALPAFSHLKTLKLDSVQFDKNALAAARNLLPDDCVIEMREPRDVIVARWLVNNGGDATIHSTNGSPLPQPKGPNDIPGNCQLRKIHIKQGMMISPEIVEALPALKYLNTISLQGTSIDERLLGQIARCTTLENLELNQVKIGAKSLQPMSQLLKLRTLLADKSSLPNDAIKVLASHPQLNTLSLKNSKVTMEQIRGLRVWPALEHLILEGVALDEDAVEAISSIKTLTRLNVKATGLSDAAREQLVEVFTRENVDHDPLDKQRLAARWFQQQGLPLTMKGGKILHPTSPLPDNALTVIGVDLEGLKMASVGEAMRRIAPFVELEELKASNDGVRNEHLAQIGKFTALRTVELKGARVNDDGVKGLAALKDLQKLDISGTLVKGSCLESLSQLTNLKSLYMNTTGISGKHLKHLETLTQLTKLELDNNKSINSGLAVIGRLKNLTELVVSHSDADDELATTLAGLKKLETLDVSYTEMSDKGIKQLAKMMPLKNLELRGCKAITASSIGELEKMTWLKTLNILNTGIETGGAALDKSLPGVRVTFRDKKQTTTDEQQR